jgi:polysaccharide export outer membrane protein
MKTVFQWIALMIFATGILHAQTNVAVVTNAVSNKNKVYVLTPNDVIDVKVYQEDDLETRGRVAKDGTLTLPLVGVVKVGGKTVEQASLYIQQLYGKDFLVNPQVGVTILEYAKRNFSVLGQVQRPGSYEIPIEESIDLIRAIAMAGGYTRIGNPSKITVQRKVGDETKIFKLDAEAMAKDKNAKPFEILPEDTVTVGEKFI